MPHHHPAPTPVQDTVQDTATGAGTIGTGAAAPAGRGLLATVWNAVTAVIGTVMGLLPHLLHHVSLLAGAALVTGAAGNLLFGVLGLLLSVPLLRRLYIRFNTWKAPATALVIFVAMFSLSAFVIGPAIAGNSTPAGDPTSPTPRPAENHSGHHGG